LKTVFQAAMKGSAEDQLRIGYLFGNPTSGFYNEELSLEWFEKAAKNNHPDAIAEYALCLLLGKNVNRNYPTNEIKNWLNKARAAGSSIMTQCQNEAPFVLEYHFELESFLLDRISEFMPLNIYDFLWDQGCLQTSR